MRYIFCWRTVFLYSLFIIFVSVIPIKGPPQLSFPFSDKLFHCLIYVILSFITTNTFYLKRLNRPRFIGFSYAFCLGLGIELIQLFLPFRKFEVADIFFNFLGSIGGCLLRLV